MEQRGSGVGGEIPTGLLAECPRFNSWLTNLVGISANQVAEPSAPSDGAGGPVGLGVLVLGGEGERGLRRMLVIVPCVYGLAGVAVTTAGPWVFR